MTHPNPDAEPQPDSLPDPDQPQDQDQPETVTARRPGWLPVSTRTRTAPPDDSETGSGEASSGTPTPPDTEASRKLFSGKSKTFRTIGEAGLEVLGGLLNAFIGQGTQAFLPDEDDKATIPPPLGRILARRVKMSEDTNLSDAADMMTAAIGLAAWAAKGLIELAQARLAKRHPPAAPPGTVTGAVVVDEHQAAAQ